MPTAKKAAQLTKNGKVGIIATPATIRTGAYERVITRHKPGVQLFDQPCPLFVPLVENGRTRPGDIVIETVVAEYLAPLRQAGVDTLVLGCTHYPLLTDVIGQYMGPQVTLIDSGAEVAEELAGCLRRQDMERRPDQQGRYRWYVSDSVDASTIWPPSSWAGRSPSRWSRSPSKITDPPIPSRFRNRNFFTMEKDVIISIRGTQHYAGTDPTPWNW